jgi:hypothetical protein
MTRGSTSDEADHGARRSTQSTPRMSRARIRSLDSPTTHNVTAVPSNTLATSVAKQGI